MNHVQHHAKKFFDNTLENIEKNVKTQTKVTAQSVKGQFVNQNPQDAGTQESGGHAKTFSDAATKEVVADFYAPSDPQAQAALSQSQLPKAGQMTPEEQAKYQKLRKQLHDEVYYNRLIERKSQEQEHMEEEKQEEEEKKMEELQLQEEKKKKDDDIALKMVTNKAEQFPGVAG